MNEIKIYIPEGMEIDEKNSTFRLIKFKRKETKLPKSWEELMEVNGYYILSDSGIGRINDVPAIKSQRKTFPTRELAEAAVALAQLLQLRDAYNNSYEKDWKPDWYSDEVKYVIHNHKNNVIQGTSYNTNKLLNFATSELCDKFISCPKIKELLEIAKPLI